MLVNTVYNFLIKTYKIRSLFLWQMLWKNFVLRNNQKEVITTIHNHKIKVNAGYPYGLLSRIYPSFNNPILEIAYLTAKKKNKRINVIDVGAATGDTFLLINENLKDKIGNIICVEAEKQFYGILKSNLVSFKNAILVNSLLSNISNQKELNVIRTHSGSGSALGNELVLAKTLDEIVDEIGISIDLIKIDVDGFDGKVLEGSSKTLLQQKPNVIFEWHPLLLKKAKNEILAPFHQLFKNGYENFTFFDKYGIFSHFMHGFDGNQLELLSEVCLNNKFKDDWHYDVVATCNDINLVELAECIFSRQKPSPY